LWQSELVIGSDKARLRAAIRRLRGILPRQPGEEPFAVWWARHKAGEIELEERQLARYWRGRPLVQADRP
jgi:hypothetical protein